MSDEFSVAQASAPLSLGAGTSSQSVDLPKPKVD
jgi:hypothetical protein